jgi:regulator of protease activity HflC (stomatin/prohibitin superfamily)
MYLAEIIIAAVVALFVIVTVMRSVRIVPQARARNVERFGRYRKTLEPGMNFIIPFIDRVKPLIDLREQVVSFKGQPVITEDNLVVLIDTVLFFQVTDPRAADYEIVDYIQAIEQLTATMLRSVIGSMDLEQTLTSRDRINNMLRGVLDDASGKWGIRVTRVEIKAIDPPKSVKDAMEKQMRAEREKRAAILTAEGVRQSKILTAEGEKQSAILTAEGAKQSAILRAEGQAQAIAAVFQAVHDNDPDPKLLAYQYLQTLPQLAQGSGNTFWVIPSEVTSALRSVATAFGGSGGEPAPGEGSGPGPGRARPGRPVVPVGGTPALDPASPGVPSRDSDRDGAARRDSDRDGAVPLDGDLPTAADYPASAGASAEADSSALAETPTAAGTPTATETPTAAGVPTATDTSAARDLSTAAGQQTAAQEVTNPAAMAGDPAQAADALSAMLASAIPGTSFVDALGPVDPVIPEASTPAVPDGDEPSANGSEAY